MTTPESSRSIAEAVLHLEIVHSDPEAAFTFLEDVLGATRVETKISAFACQAFSIHCVHAKVGNIVFQITQPPPAFPSWVNELKDNGPGVHNITFYVKDTEMVKQKMISHGCHEIMDIKIPINQIGIGKESTRVVVMDAKENTGLRFEFCEPVEGWPAGGILP
ncbi:hypothetical protein NW760_015428 [Fusarium oxysporum]|nr:hypothetical protein NW769_015407 [Fusarium oxysporum]KAJ4211940.1 hypothetical protein NW760_015428 [Fusarium oxysporum]